MIRVTNEEFVKKAEACAPKLYETVVKPVAIVDIVKTDGVYPEVREADSVENLAGHPLSRGDRLCLDFGDHQVGYVTLKLDFCGKSAGCTCIFQAEIWRNRKGDDRGLRRL